VAEPVLIEHDEEDCPTRRRGGQTEG
jgi:hypothetical protein